jgi:ribosomal protein S18 acetylase RimI-like enzyme
MPSVRRFEAHEWQAYRDLRLRALADSPDAFGSTLAVEQDRPDAEWARRLAAGVDERSQLPLVVELNGEAIGLAWSRLDVADPRLAHVYQMWVDPAYRGRGAARLLMETIVDWARANGVSTLELDVTCDNVAATRLYRAMGFMPVGDPEPLRPGSPLLKQRMQLVR